MKRVLTTWCLLGLLSSAFCLQGSAQYSVDWNEVSSGGGTSTGSVYSVSGTIGQRDADGPMTGGNYLLTGGFRSLIAAVQMTNAPFLFITQSGNDVILYWSANAISFVLENNINQASTEAWSTVSAPPVSANGFHYVTNTIAPGNSFYRLRRP